jgi:hypothetical protein
MDPLAMIDRLPTMDEAAARQLCQSLLARELGREPVYRRLLEVCLGFCQRPVQTTDGGWLQRPRRGPGGKDARVPLLTTDPRCAWNALHILRALRDTREVQLDETILPYRTQDFLNGDDALFGEVVTDNARHLWGRIYGTRTQPRRAPALASATAALPPGGGGISGGQVGGAGGGGGATAAGGADGQAAMTRLPLLLPLLDHYFFCYAYWAVTRKRAADMST